MGGQEEHRLRRLATQIFSFLTKFDYSYYILNVNVFQRLPKIEVDYLALSAESAFQEFKSITQSDELGSPHGDT